MISDVSREPIPPFLRADDPSLAQFVVEVGLIRVIGLDCLHNGDLLFRQSR